jgi:hypothetical protein
MLHVVIEARLAEEALAVVDHKERDRAAVHAFEVCKLVSMRLTHFFTVPELFLSAE